MMHHFWQARSTRCYSRPHPPIETLSCIVSYCSIYEKVLLSSPTTMAICLLCCIYSGRVLVVVITSKPKNTTRSTTRNERMEESNREATCTRDVDGYRHIPDSKIIQDCPRLNLHKQQHIIHPSTPHTAQEKPSTSEDTHTLISSNSGRC